MLRSQLNSYYKSLVFFPKCNHNNGAILLREKVAWVDLSTFFIIYVSYYILVVLDNCMFWQTLMYVTLSSSSFVLCNLKFKVTLRLRMMSAVPLCLYDCNCYVSYQKAYETFIPSLVVINVLKGFYKSRVITAKTITHSADMRQP